MKLSIVTLFACIASPVAGRLSARALHGNKASNESRKLESSETDIQKRAAIEGLKKRLAAHHAGRQLKKNKDDAADEIGIGKILVDKANRFAAHEAGRKLGSEPYYDKLAAIVAEANRNLKTVDDLQPEPSDELKERGFQLEKEMAGRDLQFISAVQDVDELEQCISDTNDLIIANPGLDEAIRDYTISSEYTSFYDPASNLTYAEVVYADLADSALEAACNEAGGYFDENEGLLACGYGQTISMTQRYVSCLANTPECRGKDKFELLMRALEMADWYCLVIEVSEAPSDSPVAVQGSEDVATPGIVPVPAPAPAPLPGSPAIADYQVCMLETNMLYRNQDLLVAAQEHIASLDGFSNPITGYVNFFYDEEAENELRRQCDIAGGHFDKNLGTLTCDLPSDTTDDIITVTVTGHVSCLANIEACTAKGHYDHLEVSMVEEGFYNCRKTVPSSSGPSVTVPATTPPNPSNTTSSAPPTSRPTPVPTSRPTPLPTMAPVFESTGSCEGDVNELYRLEPDVYADQVAFFDTLEYKIEDGTIKYSYGGTYSFEQSCDAAGGYFLEGNKETLYCSIDYEDYTIPTETTDFAMCVAPTNDCYKFNVYEDFLQESLEGAGYYDCYVD